MPRAMTTVPPGPLTLPRETSLTDSTERLSATGVSFHQNSHAVARKGTTAAVPIIAIMRGAGERLGRSGTSMGFAVGALSGDVSGIMTFGLQAAHVLQSLSYTRDVEKQADEQLS